MDTREGMRVFEMTTGMLNMEPFHLGFYMTEALHGSFGSILHEMDMERIVRFRSLDFRRDADWASHLRRLLRLPLTELSCSPGYDVQLSLAVGGRDVQTDES